jgi:hypothetical protein
MRRERYSAATQRDRVIRPGATGTSVPAVHGLTMLWSTVACTTGRPPAPAVLHHDRRMHPASRDQALAAVRAFYTERGRLPRCREWERAAPSRPCAKTIERHWRWRELLAEAIGVWPAEIEVSWVPLLHERAQAMLVVLSAAQDEFGRWPTAAARDLTEMREQAGN